MLKDFLKACGARIGSFFPVGWSTTRTSLFLVIVVGVFLGGVCWFFCLQEPCVDELMLKENMAAVVRPTDDQSLVKHLEARLTATENYVKKLEQKVVTQEKVIGEKEKAFVDQEKSIAQRIEKLEQQDNQEAKRLAVVDKSVKQEVAEQLGALKDEIKSQNKQQKRKKLFSRFLEQLVEDDDD